MKKNYIPETMGFAEGLMGPPIGAYDKMKKKRMLIDWEKAKSLTEDLLAHGRKIDRVEVGLRS